MRPSKLRLKLSIAPYFHKLQKTNKWCLLQKALRYCFCWSLHSALSPVPVDSGQVVQAGDTWIPCFKPLNSLESRNSQACWHERLPSNVVNCLQWRHYTDTHVELPRRPWLTDQHFMYSHCRTRAETMITGPQLDLIMWSSCPTSFSM